MWGGSNGDQSTSTLQAGIERGIILIDRGPIYRFGRSEESIGPALERGADAHSPRQVPAPAVSVSLQRRPTVSGAVPLARSIAQKEPRPPPAAAAAVTVCGELT
jgi:hypothetical protein